MLCEACGAETTLHHENNGVVYLLCGHTAKRNLDPSMDRVWTGLIDGHKLTINLKNRELVPVGDIVTIQKWTNGKCPICFGDPIPVKESFGSHRTFVCGHTEGTIPLADPIKEIHTQENAPNYTTGNSPRPRCQVCGNPGGDYLVSQLPENVRKCGHGYTKFPDKEPIRI